jgi:hypothetical protein
LLAAWSEGESGETTPGRTLANLKTGGLRDVLDHLAADAADGRSPAQADVDIAALLAGWMEWEKGQAPPGQVVATLVSAGLRPLLESLAAPASTVTPGPDAG